MKKNILTLTLSLLPILIFAVPARRVQRAITLPDGSQKTVTLRGDETFHYLQASDGTLYCGDEASGFRTIAPALAEATWQARTNSRQAVRQMARASWDDITRQAPRPKRLAAIGKRKGLVILANFSDRKMSTPTEEFNHYFNQKGYSNYGMAGSVHDFFLSSSYGQFDLEFDVLGPVELSKSIQYYGQNGTSGDDLHAAEMVREAVLLANELQDIDFRQYDWDGDGLVDQVYVIYAGFGEASGAPSYTIWPHEYQLSYAQYYGDGDGPLVIGGVTIDTYACSNELYGTRGKVLDGIGTACHEFSHCLGLPDVYDVSGSNFGMDYWSVMDYGCYGDDGRCPVGYTSYERWWCGWLEPVCLDQPATVTNMPSLDSSPTAYVIYNDANHNEYYLLENRQCDGWHRYDYGHGMLVIHVDYDEHAWYMNEVNKIANHQRLTIIPADNTLASETANDLAGDPWPGVKTKRELTNTSTPAAKLYNANTDGRKLMGKPITKIRENTSRHTISFEFMGGEKTDAISAPQAPNQETIYNLNGQKTSAKPATRGIYIKGGKKIINNL